MIIYRKGSPLSVLLKVSGSVLPRTVLPALACSCVTILLQWTLPQDYLSTLFDHPYPFQPARAARPDAIARGGGHA